MNAAEPNAMQAEVHCLMSNDHFEWSDFVRYDSPDLYDDGGWFFVTVGASGVEGGNDFQVCVATPRAVGRMKLAGSVPDILVTQFNAESVRIAIHDRVTAVRADSWDQLVEELRTFMHWEYEGMAES